jgi:hypothetical protein
MIPMTTAAVRTTLEIKISECSHRMTHPTPCQITRSHLQRHATSFATCHKPYQNVHEHPCIPFFSPPSNSSMLQCTCNSFIGTEVTDHSHQTTVQRPNIREQAPCCIFIDLSRLASSGLPAFVHPLPHCLHGPPLPCNCLDSVCITTFPNKDSVLNPD